MSSVYIPGQSPLLEAAAAKDDKFDAYFGTLPDTPQNYPDHYVRINSAGTGCTLVGSLFAIDYTPLWITGDATLTDANLSFVVSGSTIYDRSLIVRHSTPSTQVILTLPHNTAPGKYWVIRQAADQTGYVRLRPSTGATLQGGTSDLRLTGAYAAATVECVANPNGASAVYYVDGAVTSV